MDKLQDGKDLPHQIQIVSCSALNEFDSIQFTFGKRYIHPPSRLSIISSAATGINSDDGLATDLGRRATRK